jgi:DegV family protein with EDD domain
MENEFASPPRFDGGAGEIGLPAQISQSETSVGLVVDDVCSLPEKIINEYQIEVVKVKLFFPEAENFPEKNLFQVMKETKACPKTSAPSPGDYLKTYKKILGNHEKILVISLSSKLSATYNSAFQAKEMMPDPSKIVLFDSLTAAAAQGLLVIKAAELIREGRKIEEIVKILENFREKVKILAFLDTTYWLEKIGRMNHWQATAFKILKGLGVQPMIGTKNGRVDLTGFNFWTKDSLKAIFHQLRHIAKKSKIKVVINYTDNIDLAHKLKERIEKELKTEVIFVSLVPSIVGANTGPGTLLVGTILA